MRSRIALALLCTVALTKLTIAQSLGPVGVDANYGIDLARKGKTWTHAGRPAEPFDVFAKAGATAARIRLWASDDGMNGLNYAVDTAKQAQAAGLKPYVVMFLSDDWADFVKQPVPKIWQGLSEDKKLAAIEAYAELAARRFADAGVKVDVFEIGNEIDFGLCGVFEEAWPNRVSLDYMRAKIWPRMTPIIKAAQAGVLKATPDTKFVLHLTQWNNVPYCVAFWQFMLTGGVRVDYAGVSYFPSNVPDAQQRSFESLGKHIDAVHAAIDRPVLICETGYPASANFTGQFSDWNKPAGDYPLTPAGQAKWTADFFAFVRGRPNVAGAFYWSPEWHGGGLWDAFAWFDEHGEARPVVAALIGMPATQPTTNPTTKPQPVAARLIATPPHAESINVYLGNLHAHTGASDGTGEAAEAYAFSRDVAKLDFIAVTDHNHLMGTAKAKPDQRAAVYKAIMQAADAATRPGEFVGLFGQEYSSMSKGNHVNAFDVPNVIDVPNGDFAGLLKWLDANRDSTGRAGILQFNHPALGTAPNRLSTTEFGRDDFGDDAGWVRHMGPATALVELLNGEPGKNDPPGRAPQVMESHYRRLLRHGFRIAPTGNQDNHKKQWGTITDVRTGIMAKELTRPALLDAMRARHVYASEDKNLRVTVAVNDGLTGDVLTAAGPLRVAVKIADADEFAARYTVEAFKGRIGGTAEDVVQTAFIDGNTPAGQWAAVDGVSLERPGEFVYFRITQSSAAGIDRLWTAPAWLAPAGEN